MPDYLSISFTGADTGSGVQQAMGRVLGSLCVLTSRDDDAESGMLASWVSQASFDPPGLTVAVKKDRAVENLLQVGNRFNLNVLKDGGDKARSKRDQKLMTSSMKRCPSTAGANDRHVTHCGDTDFVRHAGGTLHDTETD